MLGKSSSVTPERFIIHEIKELHTSKEPDFVLMGFDRPWHRRLQERGRSSNLLGSVGLAIWFSLDLADWIRALAPNLVKLRLLLDVQHDTIVKNSLLLATVFAGWRRVRGSGLEFWFAEAIWSFNKPSFARDWGLGCFGVGVIYIVLLQNRSLEVKTELIQRMARMVSCRFATESSPFPHHWNMTENQTSQ